MRERFRLGREIKAKGCLMRKPEKKCPVCGSKISWKTVHGELGQPSYNGLCTKPGCNILLMDRETPQLTRGRNLERRELKGIDCMDKRITSLSCDVQIGILRERQKHLHLN